MNLDEALELYEDYLAIGAPIDLTPPHVEGICDECRTPMGIANGSMWVCMECGDIEELGAIVEPIGYRPKKSLYHRRSYFIERMNLICGFKQSQHKDYRSVVRKCKKHKIKNIVELRAIMKKLSLHKFYKYIYNIYYDIKKVRLVKLTRQRIAQLADEFIVLESFFKQNRDNHKRKNIYSYSVLIYMLLKRHKIKGYSKLLLPHQPKRIIKQITEYCSE